MGTALQFEKEKLILAMLYTDEELAEKMQQILIKTYGEVDLISPAYCFSDISPYYDAEMDGKVYRRLFSFRECRDPSELAEIKIATNALEQSVAVAGNRRLNLDPGFISCGRLSLATTKNAGHRIPLHDGIYAELTLFYARNAWHPFPWTYMDFKMPQVHEFLLNARKIYMKQRRECRVTDENVSG